MSIHNIKVIQQHIDAGIPRSPESCPVALALIQHFGRPVKVGKTFFWFETFFWFDDEKNAEGIDLPTVAIKFQNDFDKGFKTLSPFGFLINTADSSAGCYCKEDFLP